MSSRQAKRLFVSVSLLIFQTGCHDEAKAVPTPGNHELTVFAASSLRESFTALGQGFEAAHAGTHVVLSFAGSQTLRAQIEHGAPVDVFASADERHMSALVAAGRVQRPELFAKNELVVVVPRAKASSLREFRQLAEAERVVMGAPEVPVGEYTERMLARAAADLGADFRTRVESHVVSHEPDVRQVLAKIALGEADAGIVYRTDASAAKDKVAVVEVPAAYNVTAEYPVAVTAHAREPELAHAFVGFLLSSEGERTLAASGFLPPDAAGAH